LKLADVSIYGMCCITDENVNLFAINEPLGNGLIGKKLVTIGDSITFQTTWQSELVRLTGMIWSYNETTEGVDGYSQMGYGGARITPSITYDVDYPSIYARANDSAQYSPDIIILWGGQNDYSSVVSWTADTTNSDLVDTVDNLQDEDSPREIFTSDTYLATGETNFREAYRGVLQRLRDSNPDAKIFCLGIMKQAGVTTLTDPFDPIQDAVKLAMCDVIEEAATIYGARYIHMYDLFSYNDIEELRYFSDDVHPSSAGGKRIAKYLASQIFQQ
jgi:lysophospholipase L1-like esterase